MKSGIIKRAVICDRGNIIRTCPGVVLADEQKQILEEITRSRQLPHGLVLRAQMVLLMNASKRNKTISEDLHVQEETVGKWRKRRLLAAETLEAAKGKPKALRQVIEPTLAGAPRPGIEPTFTAGQVCQIIALACETPPDYLSHWPHATLAQEAVKRGIVERISSTTVGRFLKSGTDKAAFVALLAQP